MNINLNNNQNIVISLGDPAGIGMEVTLKALSSPNLPKAINPILIGCQNNLKIIHRKLREVGIKNLIDLNKIEIQDLPIHEKVCLGKTTKLTGDASFNCLTKAASLVIQGKARALVTAPISKHAWHLAGHEYPGQTERLAVLSSTRNESMLFTAKSPKTNWRLNTLLATTHIPFENIIKELTPELIISKLNTLLNFCQKFNNHPKIVIAGINPHAGEEGKLGLEEKTWLIPVINEWKAKHPEASLIGPLAPDTCWLSAAKAWHDNAYIEEAPDGFLALYHDQGLIAVKMLAFDNAVNTTLGLPFIRTSPDHGTGLDIANQFLASPNSMISAIQTAWYLSE